MNRATKIESLENRQLLSTVHPGDSLQAAANAAKPGDVVDVLPGNYKGFQLSQGGTAAAPITFHAEPGVVINQTGNGQDGINLEGASYVTIEGFKVIGAKRAGIRAVTDNHVILRGNTCDANVEWGIAAFFSDDVLIENNIASNTREQHGIYVGNSAQRPVLRGNECFGNGRNGIFFNGDKSEGGSGLVSGALIENNNSHDNTNSGISGDGLRGATIQNNFLSNNGDDGIRLYRIDAGGASTLNVITGNQITGNGGSGVTVYNRGSITLRGNTITGGVLAIQRDARSTIDSDFNTFGPNARFSVRAGDDSLTLVKWRIKTGQDLNSTQGA